MEKSQIKIIEDILSPFSFGKKQDLLNLLNHLKKNNISLEILIEYLEDMKRKHIEILKEHSDRMRQLQEKWNKVTTKCPECRSPMGLSQVNTHPGNQTGDKSKSVWICPNKDCQETIFNTQTVQEILNQIRGKS